MSSNSNPNTFSAHKLKPGVCQSFHWELPSPCKSEPPSPRTFPEDIHQNSEKLTDTQTLEDQMPEFYQKGPTISTAVDDCSRLVASLTLQAPAWQLDPVDLLLSENAAHFETGEGQEDRISDHRMKKSSASMKTSMYRGSTSSDISDESNWSSMSNNISKPHKANDLKWEAIQAVRAKDGQMCLNHFQLLKRLGSGDIGSVYLSELKGTKCYFAIKVMDKTSLASRNKLLRALTEKEILQCLDHPFLPTLYTHFETENYSCLVMEFCPGGDLHNLRQKQPGKYFPEQAVRFYVAEVLLALEYLHMLGIIYRDLKPENVLVRDDGHIMLSDFDLSLRCTVVPSLIKSSFSVPNSINNRSNNFCVQPACIQPSCAVPTTCFAPRFFSKSKKARKPKPEIGNQVRPLPELIAEPSDARSMSFVGTHEYLAPEIIKGEGHGSAVDWWTFGIFLYELLFGKTPFKGSGNRATLFNVVGQPLRFPESPPVSSAARDLIRGLLVKEPQHRLAFKRGATEIRQHPFFEGVNWALIRCASPPEIPNLFEIRRPAATVTSTSNSRPDPNGNSLRDSDKYLEFDFF